MHDVGNTLVSWQIHCGDVAGTLAAADVVVREIRSQHVEHAYLEPEAGVGWLETACSPCACPPRSSSTRP